MSESIDFIFVSFVTFNKSMKLIKKLLPHLQKK